MSVRAGIALSEGIVSKFVEARQGDTDVRYIKLVLENALSDSPSVALAQVQTKGSSAEQDFKQMKDETKADEPSFFIFNVKDLSSLHLENKSSDAKWVLIWYCNDNSKVKLKMLASSSVEPIRTTLGNKFFLGDYKCNDLSELTFDEFIKNFSYKQDPSKYTHESLSFAEKQVLLEKEGVNLDTVHSTVSGLNLPLDSDAKQSLEQFRSSYQLLIFKISNETIMLDKKESKFTADEIAQYLSTVQDPRYILFNFEHVFEEQQTETVFFIYYCSVKAKVKERMVYSSTKQSVVQLLSDLKVGVSKSMEISEAVDISEKILFEYVHPVEEKKLTFSKPKPMKRK